LIFWNTVLTFNRLHGTVSENIEVFITTTPRTSNPTEGRWVFPGDI
jgi:hypothetical protein